MENRMPVFRKAENGDIPTVCAIVARAIRRMEDAGIYQWDDLYPTAAHFSADVDEGTLYAILQDEKPVGFFCINETECPEYVQADWKGERFLVVHRLVIAPEAQGRGIAKSAMRFAGEMAKKRRMDSIRLDAFVGNPAAVNLYGGLGYVSRGIAEFRKGAFHLFEKQL